MEKYVIGGGIKSNLSISGIISRAAAKNGHIYGEEDDQESLANSDNQQPNYSTVQRNKKLSWVENEAAAGLGNSIDNLSGTENNLTVYFWAANIDRYLLGSRNRSSLEDGRSDIDTRIYGI